MKTKKKITTRLTAPRPLACDCWLSDSVKCAETAVFLVERNGESLLACEQHRKKMARVIGK